MSISTITKHSLGNSGGCPMCAPEIQEDKQLFLYSLDAIEKCKVVSSEFCYLCEDCANKILESCLRREKDRENTIIQDAQFAALDWVWQNDSCSDNIMYKIMDIKDGKLIELVK